ncbi:MAG: AMP phosphorylase [Candidatus Methanomethylophilaceae archaeon]|jgi:AMP phosphorylase|nr:AMP phosphorylase [Candidatus Methanomethylophilaceae archaeon]MDD3986673.1 AMP phosphorylase [Candidatus Methanomethylophilaceae archaeon]MDD4709529.1 AMP phosphorylase [Candidatus Methanomethylophilaceae archaeon]MDY0251681.1 AMP phosphorylase [Candidatus Methanomethylophilaceae archaeon]
MKLKVKYFDVDASEPTVLMHDDDCEEIGVQENDRVRLEAKGTATALVSRTDTLVERGTIMVPAKTMAVTGAKDGSLISVEFAPAPESVRSIRKKMDGEVLSKDEIFGIVRDILDTKLSKIEISAWLTSLYINGMCIEEIADFATAMVDTGDRIVFDRKPVYDFHSMGGVPGNKVTPIVVSIVAAAGLMLPKTSSRAISSACGTSDFVETFCEVALSADRLKDVAEDTGGALAWGGAINLAPVDDLVIKIEHPLGINPRAQMLASILSKKLAIGAEYLLIDIPMGVGTKVPDIDSARAYARDFMDLGDKLGMHVECAITYADQPVGSAVGPNLEARECIRILEGDGHPASVAEKACELAGIVLEMGGISNGSVKAREILNSGAALRKFKEIVEAQGGSPEIKSEDLKPGEFMAELRSNKSGYVHGIKNKDIVAVAKAAGSPNDKGAGLLLFRKKGQRVESGDVLMEIYAENEAKLQRAMNLAERYQPVDIQGMLIKRVSVPNVKR